MSAPTTTKPRLLAETAVLSKTVAGIRDQLAFVVDPSLLGDLVLELDAFSGELDGLRAQLAMQAKNNGVPQHGGVRTIGQFVGANSNRSPERSRTDAGVAKWLRQFDLFQTAFFEGRLTAAHIRVLKRLDTIRTFGALRDSQQMLVDAATGVKTFSAFEQVCEYWQSRVDPDGKEPKDQLESNAVRFRKGSGGRGSITMDLDAISFAAAKQMIDARSDKLRNAHVAREEATGQQSYALRNRTASGDRFDATMSLLVDGAARPDGTHANPLVNIVMSERVAQWAAAKMRGEDVGDPPLDAFDLDGRCELIDGTAIHPLLVAATCGFWQWSPSDLRRYVMAADSRIVDYSYNARVAPEHLRTAVLIQDRGQCVVQGCDAPHTWMQIDHRTAHGKGGKTRLSNLQTMCRPDNFAKSDGQPGWQHKPRPRGSTNSDTADSDSDSDTDTDN